MRSTSYKNKGPSGGLLEDAVKYIVRTLDKETGKTISLETVEAKRNSIKEKLLESGFQALEHQGKLSTYNALGQRISETVYIIEAMIEGNYY